MYTLRYKLPLEVMLNEPIEKNGYDKIEDIACIDGQKNE